MQGQNHSDTKPCWYKTCCNVLRWKVLCRNWMFFIQCTQACLFLLSRHPLDPRRHCWEDNHESTFRTFRQLLQPAHSLPLMRIPSHCISQQMWLSAVHPSWLATASFVSYSKLVLGQWILCHVIHRWLQNIYTSEPLLGQAVSIIRPPVTAEFLVMTARNLRGCRCVHNMMSAYMQVRYYTPWAIRNVPLLFFR